MLFKTIPTTIKSVDSEAGVFSAYVSVFDNVDSYGDVVRKGAFARTLEDWQAKGAPIPVLWSHRTDDPDMNIGHVIEATEDDRGLLVKAQIDLDSPKGATVHRLMKGGRVREFSFAYSVTDGSLQTKDGKSFYEIRAVDLYEVGPTPIGANPATELLDLKARATEVAHQVKAGRTLSAANEAAIRDSLELAEAIANTLKSVLPAGDPELTDDSVEDQESTSGKTSPPEAIDEKSSGPAASNPSVALALTNIKIQSVL